MDPERRGWSADVKKKLRPSAVSRGRIGEAAQRYAVAVRAEKKWGVYLHRQGEDLCQHGSLLFSRS